MANIKISELTALTPPDAADLVPVTDSSASQTKRTTVGEIVGIINGDVDVANNGTATISELPVSKLQYGAARQLLQTDAAGTGVEWTSNVDVPGTLDVTSTATLDAALNVAGLASLDGGIDVDGAFTVADTSGNVATSGTLGVDGQSTLASAAVSDLTSGRVVLAGTSGELEDNAKLTFNGTQLDVDGNVVITGELKHIGGGSEGSPAVYFAGSAPSNSLYVEATTGHVGLGTNEPEQRLQVVDTSAGVTTTPILVQNRGNAASTAVQIALIATGSDFSDGQYAAIKAYSSQGTANTSHDLAFLTCTTGGTPTERLYITREGNVGVGTTNVDELLHVESDGATPKIKVESTLANSSPGFRVTNDARTYDIRIDGTNDNLQFYDATASEGRVAIDSSGRLLVGTSTSASAGGNAQFARLQVFGNTYDDSYGVLNLGRKEASTSITADEYLGAISFSDQSGNEYANIIALADASAGSGVYPGRLVFSTTADVAGSPTERLRITNDGVFGYNQPAPVAVDATATLTVANLKTGIITSTTAAAVTMTLPTGTLTEAGFSGLYNNFTFEWTVINTGATNAVTVQGDTGHTLVGSGTVAAGVSGRFASRRTAANTFVTYRLS